MKAQHYLFLGLAGLAVTAIFIFYHRPTPVLRHPYDFSAPCPGKEKTIKMNDNYMIGAVEFGQELKLIPNWYWCHPAGRGDLVLLRFAPNLEPVVRRIYAVAGDEFQVTYNKMQGAWNIEVNHQKLKLNGQDYFFGANSEQTPPLLKLLESSRKGVLLDREIIVFSSRPPGNRDSGTLGVVNLNDVIGKIEDKGSN